MKNMLWLLCVAAWTVWGAERMAVTREMTEELKRTVSWQVTEYENNIFRGWTEQEVLAFIGKNGLSDSYKPIATADDDEPSRLHVPEEFDARKNWPTCRYVIKDQSYCGSCYAFGSTSALADRFCIAGKNIDLAPQDLVSCDKTEFGCGGGLMDKSYAYLENTGAVTEECFPYVSGNFPTPPCPQGKCPSGQPWQKYKCQPGSVHSIHEKAQKVREEIFANGSVTTMHRFCNDFTYYRSGIYFHKAGECHSWHIVKILGWGRQDGIDYWIVANSFGRDWGEDGYVRFKTEDCEINRNVFFCTPLIE